MGIETARTRGCGRLHYEAHAPWTRRRFLPTLGLQGAICQGNNPGHFKDEVRVAA